MRSKGKEYAVAGVLGTGLIPAVIGLMVCIAAPVFVYTITFPDAVDAPPTDHFLLAATSVAGVLGMLYFGRLTWLCWCGTKESIQAAKGIKYVPPVTADTLPADEILVRGAQPPLGVQSEVLLRAAQGEHETVQEELLRIVDD